MNPVEAAAYLRILQRLDALEAKAKPKTEPTAAVIGGNGPGYLPCPEAMAGMVVHRVLTVGVGPPFPDGRHAFESIVSVAGKIRQISAVDYSQLAFVVFFEG